MSNDTGYPDSTWTKPQAAGWYAARGWLLIPLHDVDSGRCSCAIGRRGEDCPDAGKHPRNLHGVRGATSDADVVRGWWETFPHANIGIATGRPFAFVVDEDESGAIKRAWRERVNVPAVLAGTVGQSTPNGQHYLFDAAEGFGNSTGGRGRSLGVGIDTRGEGGYIIVAPSETPSGRYVWRSDPRGPWPSLPGAMVDALRKPAPKPMSAATNQSAAVDADADRIARYVSAAVGAAARELAGTEQGALNHTLNEVAFRLGTLGAHGVLDESTAFTAIADAWDEAWHGAIGPDGRPSQWSSFHKTWSSGWTAGTLRPREPWPPVDRPAASSSGLGFTPAAATAAAEQPVGLRDLLVDTNGLDDIPEPEPLVPGVLYRDSIAWIYGAPGCGKSFVSLDLSGAVGTGSHWQALGLAEKGDVLYLVAEGVRGIRRRVRAWESANDLRMTGVSFLPVAVQAGQPAEWAALVELAGEMRPALIVVDTQARVTVGMDENSAQDMGTFVDRVERLRKASGACVLVVHHTGRAGEHMRGSIALDGAASTLIAVEKSDELISLRCAKQKDEDEFKTVRLALTPHEDSAVLVPAVGAVLGAASWLIKWWDMFGSGATSKSDLLAALDIPPSTFFARIGPAVKDGRIVREQRGRSAYYSLRNDPQAPTGLAFGNASG